MIGIYKITEKNNPDNFYIGQSNDIARRFKEHQTKTYEQSRIPFDKQIKEKGIDAFNYEVLEECLAEELLNKEQYWIEKLQAQTSGNVFPGGLRNVLGNNNPNAKLTEDDVKIIRTAYNSHLKQKEVYEKYKDIISFQYFQNLWQGRAWPHIMPEVFTEENKQYYSRMSCKGENGSKAAFTNEEVIEIRQRYVTESAKQIYADYSDRVSFQTLQSILWGRAYSDLPIYKKKEKTWINTEPVSTIL